MVSVVREEKIYRKLINDWQQESFKEGKVFCQACAREDKNRNMLASSWKEYSNLEFKRNMEFRDKKDVSKILEILKDFVCPRGHGVSVSTPPPKKKEE